MRKILPLLLAALICIPLAGQKKRYDIGDIPNVQLQDARRFVSNPDGILSSGAVQTIDEMLSSLRQTGRAQVAVVAVNSIGSADPFDFLHRLAESWGIGASSKDNGLAILLVIDQGAIEIQTGYGLEGDLPDAILNRVINNYMLPEFRRQDWDAGMIAGVKAVKDILDGNIPEDIARESETDGEFFWLIFILFLLFPIVIIAVVIFFSGRCPKCKKRALKRVSTQTLKKSNGQRVERTTYVCKNCGHTVTRDHNINSGGGGPIIIGGGGFGGGSRGGFGGGSSGGSWGGGSFGGGGARGRF